MIIIPIGLQCTNASFKKNINKTSFTLPFDWMFATPKFVFEMLYLLLEEKINIDELVKSHFFLIDGNVSMNGLENYYTCNDGFALHNTKYNVIFPHDENTIETINKYKRRFERLKELILDKNQELIFIYSSQSSLKNGNFTINNNQVIQNVYFYISKIYTLISNYRNNYKIILFDTIKNEEKKLLNENIILCELDECDNRIDVLKQMNNYQDLFL